MAITTIQKTNFSHKHIALIAVTGIVLFGLALMQRPIRDSNATRQAALSTPNPVPVSYDLVAQEMNATSVSQTRVADAKQGHSTLSTDVLGSAGNNISGGAVLGASTVNQDILTPYENEKVNTIDNNSADAVQSYAEQSTVVVQNDDAANMVLQSSHTTIRQPDLEQRELKLIQDLRAIAVPNSLAEYHSLLINYYVLKFAASTSPQSANIQGVVLPAIMQRLDELTTAAQSKLGIYLPKL